MRKFSLRILTIYATGLIIFLIIKSLAIPPTFGEFGWYRGESVKEITNLSQKFADTSQCFDCHVEEYALWSVGKHKKVECESCHGALKAHVLNPEYKLYLSQEYLSPKAYPSIQAFCLSCHSKSKSKPESFPQITIAHEKTVYWDCLECHNPHNPLGEEQ